MSESIVLWIFGTLIGILTLTIAGVFGWMISHGKHCSERHAEASREFGDIGAKLDRVIKDIGDHDSGLRGQVHDLAKDISPYVIREQVRRGE